MVIMKEGLEKLELILRMALEKEKLCQTCLS